MICQFTGCQRDTTGNSRTDYCYRHNAPAKKFLRHVYHALRCHRNASVYELASYAHLSVSTAQRAIWALERAGLIEHELGVARTAVLRPAVIYHGNPLEVVWLDL